MRKITSWILFIIFGCTLWYVGCTFYYHKDFEGKKSTLIQEIHNAIGRDTLYECESVKYRTPIGLFGSSKEFIEKYGYTYHKQKYRGCVDGRHHYELENWPWLIEKSLCSNNGEYVSYRIVPVAIYSENKLDYFYVDSLLIESYNDYLHNFCPSNVDESDHSSFRRHEEMHRIVDSDPTFDLEKPENDIPEVDLYKLIVDNNIVVLEITKNTSQLTPRRHILESESKVRKIGCFIVVLLVFIICIVWKKCTYKQSGKTSNILNVIMLVLSIAMWGWFYKSVVVVNEEKEIEAQKRLDRMFDEDVVKIYPMIKEAAEKSTLFKSLEADVVKDVYSSYGYRYELEENLDKFYNSNHALFSGRIIAERLTSLIIVSYLHTSKRTDADRLKIKADIQNVGRTIHALLKMDPSEINEKEDGERYINECDSLNRQVLYQVRMLEQDIRKLKDQE